MQKSVICKETGGIQDYLSKVSWQVPPRNISALSLPYISDKSIQREQSQRHFESASDLPSCMDIGETDLSATQVNFKQMRESIAELRAIRLNPPPEKTSKEILNEFTKIKAQHVSRNGAQKAYAIHKTVDYRSRASASDPFQLERCESLYNHSIRLSSDRKAVLQSVQTQLSSLVTPLKHKDSISKLGEAL